MTLNQNRTRPAPSHRGRSKNSSGSSRTTIRVLVTLSVIAVVLVGLAIKKHSTTASPADSNRSSKPTVSAPSGWNLVFDSNFSGKTLNGKVWATCFWWASSTSNGCTDNSTLEKEWYLPSQVRLSGGVLQLVAQPEATQGQTETGKSKAYSCRSGMVTAEPGLSFTYGFIQVVARVPYGPGLWPALWLAPSNHQWPPEIDIMEHWASDQQAKVYDHVADAPTIGGPIDTPANLSEGWHTFSLLWTQTGIDWYIDGTKVYSASAAIDVPHQAMTFIANVADNISGPGTCSGTMDIKSVKVWQPVSA
jgi:beta-glucanase (GH16 family)